MSENNNKNEFNQKADSEQKQKKECPFCSEEIFVSAKKCKHCGEILDPVLRKQNEKSSAPPIINNNIATSTAVSQKVGGGYRRSFPHFLNFFLTIITGGAWIVIWILWYVFRSDKYR